MTIEEKKEPVLSTGYGDLQRLNPRHFKIIEFVLRGITDKAIGKKLGMSSRAIGLIRHSPQFQHEVAIRREKIDEMVNHEIAHEVDEVAEALKEAGLKAANKLIGGLDSSDETIVLRSSTDILDRAGYPKVTKNIGTVAATIGIGEEMGKLLLETLDMDKD